jgi:hypothetical protein
LSWSLHCHDGCGPAFTLIPFTLNFSLLLHHLTLDLAWEVVMRSYLEALEKALPTLTGVDNSCGPFCSSPHLGCCHGPRTHLAP